MRYDMAQIVLEQREPPYQAVYLGTATRRLLRIETNNKQLNKNETE
jgi:hypothetical protein